MSPPWFASAEVATVLASLVKPPVAVMVIFPARPGGAVVPSKLMVGSVPILALLIWLPVLRVTVPALIMMSPARPLLLVLLLILAPFEIIRGPALSTTSPPRPSLMGLGAIEPLSRINVFAVIFIWPASEWLAWLEMWLPPEILTESALMV